MDYSNSQNRQDSYSRYLQTTSFLSLDGLRAIAILAVFWHHFATVISGWTITGRGFLGVDLFFIISGFLIVTLLLRERRGSGSLSVRHFYIRRFFRIFPAYYLMLFVVGATAFLKPGFTSVAIKQDIIFAAFYLSNLVPMTSMLAITWSLAAEEQFYIIVPALEKYARRSMPFFLPVAYILVSLPSFGFFPTIELPSFFRETTFGPILLGVMLAHVLDHQRYFLWLYQILAWRPVPVFALALVFLVTSYPADDISGWPRLTMHWTMLILVASCVIQERNFLQPILSLRPIRKIGIVSYGMYLYQHVVAHFVHKGMENIVTPENFRMTYFTATVLATWAVAECSYRYFETPFLKAKARFAPGKYRSSTTK